MNLNLSKFKKLTEDKKSATFQHPDGHKITVAKHVLSQNMKNEISKMPMHLDEGGDVPQLNLELPAYDPKEAAYKLLSDKTVGLQAKEDLAKRQNLDLSGQQIENLIPQVNPRAEEVPIVPDVTKASMADDQLDNSPSNVPQIETEDKAQQAPPTAPAPVSTGLEQQKKGIQAEADTQGKIGNEEAKAYQQAQDATTNIMKNYQDASAPLKNEITALGNDIKQGHIDPNRVMANMGTMGKISTAIGLILGGLGGGLTGKDNPALTFLNNAITQDVEAQKSDMNSKHNLLTANMEHLKDLGSAANMSIAQHMEIAKNEVAKVIAQNQNPLVQARAQQLMGNLAHQQEILVHQTAVGQMLQNGQLPANAASYLTPDQQAKSIKLPNGMLGMAASKEDAETARKAFDTYDTITSQLQEMKSFQQEHGITLPLTDANVQAAAMRESVINDIRELRGLKRISPELTKQLEEAVPDVGSFRQGKASIQLDHLIQHINLKKSQDANAYLMGPNMAPTAPMNSPNLNRPNLKQKSFNNVRMVSAE